MNVSTNARRLSRSRTRRDAGTLALEALESRQHLAADLSVRFDPEAFRTPSIVVPGDRISPDTAFDATIEVRNRGPMAANGRVNIVFYLSTDSVLSSDDVELRRYNNEAIFLSADDAGTFGPDMRIPAETLPGSYRLITRVTANRDVDDRDDTNNIAVSPVALLVERRFGSFNNRSNVELVLNDGDGTLVAFTLTGGGNGTVEIDSQGLFTITTRAGGRNSDLLIRVNGGDGVIEASSITVNGGLRSFSAAPVALAGPFTVGRSISSITLGNVIGPSTITIPRTSTPTAFSFRRAADLSINSAVGISSLTAAAVVNTDGLPDTITARYLDTLTIGGGQGQSGNFAANLRLLGGAAPNQTATLRAATIAGIVNGGTWSINGPAASVSVRATLATWSASFAGRVTTFTATNILRGTLAASSFGTISVTRDLLAARILAGANLGADGALGGTDAAVDTFSPGAINTITVGRRVADSIIAAGLADLPANPLTDSIRLLGGNSSSIGRVTIGTVDPDDSRIITNRVAGPVTVAGQPVNPATSPLFAFTPQAPVAAVFESAVVGPANVNFTLLLTSSSLVNLPSIATGAIVITGPNGFSAQATLISRAFVPGTFQSQASALFRLTPNDGNPWTPEQQGVYSISVVENTLRDRRGAFAPAGEIATFTVA